MQPPSQEQADVSSHASAAKTWHSRPGSTTCVFGSREAYATRLEKSTGTRSGKGQDFDLRVGLGTRLSGSRWPRLFPQHAKRYRSRPVVENRTSTARHTLPSWGIVGQEKEVRRCIALARPSPCHNNTLDSGPP